ncbi:MAG: hypothetical protein HZA49_02815 [Planctomycetes bacterium]|nr:hypothetical protein [Planctomycetota bacterium]
MAKIKAKLLESRLFSLKEGNSVKEEKDKSANEEYLKRIIRENIERLIPNTKDVTWIGREFKNVDLFGVDKTGHLVICEAKVKSVPVKIVDQVRKQWEKIKKLSKREHGKEIDKYKKSCIESNKSKHRFMPGVSMMIKHEQDGLWLLDKIIGKHNSIRGVKFIIIAPRIAQRVFQGFTDLQNKHRNIKISYVLTKLFKMGKNRFILSTSLEGWKRR